ncbi:MAG: 6-pyruvoyl-tetrahydropterin synthase-related protein [Patescibacteria group bacterium]
MKILSVFGGFIAILVLSFFAVFSLTSSGYFPMHDDTQPSRVYQMQKSLSEGQFPVRWVGDLGYGYGYPIFNFYAPLPYYIGAVFSFFTVDVIFATKLMIIVGMLLSGFAMYLLGAEVFGKYAGLTTAVAYVYAPYHAVDLYVRGDVSEFWAYAFVPLVFYSLWKIFHTQKRFFILLGSISYAGLILSHNLSALMVSPFIIVFLLVLSFLPRGVKKKIIVRKMIIAFVGGLILSAFYWVPVFFEMQYTNVLSQLGGGADFRNHFACLSQLWNSPWGFGGSIPGCIDGLSFKIGKIHLLISVISIFLSLLLILRRMSDLAFVLNPKGILFLFSAISFLLSIFLMLDWSRPIWEYFPTMAFFQYPWRFLFLVSFFSSLLIGFFVWLVGKSILETFHSPQLIFGLFAISVTGLVFVSNYALFQPQTMQVKSPQDYTSESALKWNISKISDEYLPRHFEKPREKNEVVSDVFIPSGGLSQITQGVNNTLYSSAGVQSKSTGDVLIRKAYFPAWNVFVDGQKKYVTITSKGMMVRLEEGKHLVELKFVSTFIEKLSNGISLVGLLIFFVGIATVIRKPFYE